MKFSRITGRETLAERICSRIKESILNGSLQAGEALPSEPELEEQFGVSRAAVRDAVRMLKAQGLIDIIQGKGMFVTSSQVSAFTDALITTLRREKATAWDVEQYEQVFLPQVFALAAEEADETDLIRIREKGELYLDSFQKMTAAEDEGDKRKIASSSKSSKKAFKEFMEAVFDSTHNKMVRLMGEVLLSLRKWRTIEGPDGDAGKILELERKIIGSFITAVESGDGEKAAFLVRNEIALDESLISIMKKTAVGASPVIPGGIFFKSYEKKI